MTDVMAQWIAGGVLVAVAAAAGLIGYRIGRQRGAREALSLDDIQRHARRRDQRQQSRTPGPPRPPTAIH